MIKNKYRIKNKYTADIEPHEVFLDNLAKNEERESGFSEKKLEVPLKERTAYILLTIFLLLALLLFTKTFYLQIIDGKKLYALAENNKGKSALVKPERGIIYDRSMKKMVANSPDFDLVCDRRSFPASSEETLKELSELASILGKDSSDLQNEMNSSLESGVLLSENLPQETLLILEARLKEFPGCQIENNIIRNYVLGLPFSHLLGYTGRVTEEDMQNLKSYALNDSSGKTGLEKSYEDYLRGVPGKVESQKTAIGVQKGQKVVQDPIPGDNLVLNIDAELQQKIYDELGKSIETSGAKKGAAVAMDPRNGQVLAIVSYPSFDDNLFSKGISQKDLDILLNDPSEPFFNRAISAQYPTGSTIKPFEALGVLQEKLISPDKLINDPGYIDVTSKYDPSIVYRFGGITPHGLVDMRKAIAVSSNIYFYTVGGGYKDQQGLGPTRISKYLSLFGWGQKTGIDLPGEFKGFIPSPDWKKQVKGESWWDGDTYNLAIGQSDLEVTPLQLASAYCAIANNGTLYKPQIVQKIIDTSGEKPNIVQEFKPEIIRQGFIDAANLKIVREGMRDGVQESYGTSNSLNNLPVPVAAKTGTAETGRAGYTNSWSSAFGPYENPNIVLVVTVEDIHGLRAAALPVVRNTLQWYFSR